MVHAEGQGTILHQHPVDHAEDVIADHLVGVPAAEGVPFELIHKGEGTGTYEVLGGIVVVLDVGRSFRPHLIDGTDLCGNPHPGHDAIGGGDAAAGSAALCQHLLFLQYGDLLADAAGKVLPVGGESGPADPAVVAEVMGTAFGMSYEHDAGIPILAEDIVGPGGKLAVVAGFLREESAECELVIEISRILSPDCDEETVPPFVQTVEFLRDGFAFGIDEVPSALGTYGSVSAGEPSGELEPFRADGFAGGIDVHESSIGQNGGTAFGEIGTVSEFPVPGFPFVVDESVTPVAVPDGTEAAREIRHPREPAGVESMPGGVDMGHTQTVLRGGDPVPERVGPDKDLLIQRLTFGIDVVRTSAVPHGTGSFGESEDFQEGSAESLLPVQEVFGAVVVGSETVHAPISRRGNKTMAGCAPPYGFNRPASAGCTGTPSGDSPSGTCSMRFPGSAWSPR